MHERAKRLLETSDHYLDKWPWDGNHAPPLDDVVVARFQKRINKICGLSASGKPNVRLIWPASSDESISMHVVGGEKRARYGIYSQEYQCERQVGGITAVELVTVDVTFPRWVMEEFDEPSGAYTHLFTVGYHDERCCDGSESINGEICYGLYREPEQRDLDHLQRRVKAREQYYRSKPDEPMSYGEMQDWLSRIRTWRERHHQAVKQGYKEAIISGLTPQRARLFSEDPTVQKWGAYHFLGKYHSKSGGKSAR